MAALSQILLHSQRQSHQAACAENAMRRNPAIDTPELRADVAAAYALSRQDAGAFAVFSDLHPAANDEGSPA